MIWNILINIGIFICFVLIAIGTFTLLVFIICSCKVSGNCSREEEAYIPKHLDPKDLDDEIKWEDDFVYDDEFVKREDK